MKTQWRTIFERGVGVEKHIQWDLLSTWTLKIENWMFAGVRFSDTDEYRPFDEPLIVDMWDVVDILHETQSRLEKPHRRAPEKPFTVYFSSFFASATGPWENWPMKTRNHLAEFYEELTDEDTKAVESTLLEVNSQARSNLALLGNMRIRLLIGSEIIGC